jgi:predicted transposase/invertase (TIGR01784 family)
MFHKFLDPKNDVAFKKIFGNEKNQDILIHFLNDVLVFSGNDPICEVAFLKTNQDPEFAYKKTSIVDVLCTDEKGRHYIVEMQVASTTGFEKRAMYYAAKAYCSQANIGEKYQNLKEIIFLAIADYVMFPAKTSHKSDHVILDKETYEQDLKDFSFTFIELPKFTKTIEELSSVEEKWFYFFKHAKETSPENLQKLIGNEEIIARAYQELDRFFWNDQEISDYERAEKARNDYLSSMNKKFTDGKEEGKEEERAKAEIEKAEIRVKAEIEKAEIRAKAELEKAEIQAKAELEKAEIQAKAEIEKAQEKILVLKDTARNLLKLGMSISVVQSTTQLSIEEIESLDRDFVF